MNGIGKEFTCDLGCVSSQFFVTTDQVQQYLSVRFHILGKALTKSYTFHCI